MVSFDLERPEGQIGYGCPICGGALGGAIRCNDDVPLDSFMIATGRITCESCGTVFWMVQFYAPTDDYTLETIEDEEEEE